jgi:hypothetical protein
MPVRVFAGATPPSPQSIVDRWSDRAGIAADEMTVNVLRADQAGKAYQATAWLYLPPLWSSDGRHWRKGPEAVDDPMVQAARTKVITAMVAPLVSCRGDCVDSRSGKPGRSRCP